MGNCMKRSSTTRQVLDEEEDDHEQLRQVKEGGDEFEKDQNGNFKRSGLKLKIMLTKDELEWLMTELKDEEGEKKSLEELLSEIERGRVGKVNIKAYWKPSLESIFESPEGMEMDR